MRLFKILAIYMLMTSFLQCTKEENLSDKTLIYHETVKKDTLSKKIIKEKKEIKFYPFVINRKDSAFALFSKKFSKEEIYVILAINRLDYKNRWRADTLVVPDIFEKDFKAYSPFPLHIKNAEKINKLVLFSYPIHAFASYQNGELIKWGPTSMGKKSAPTKRGLTFTNWKKKVAISTVNSEWILRWNFNIFNYLGIGWHQYDLPGFHASHSCLRMLEADAFWMYNWADQWILNKNGTQILAKGTPVIIFGEPDFRNKPWMQLLKSSKADDYTEEQLNAEIEPYLEEILMQQNIRKSYLKIDKIESTK